MTTKFIKLKLEDIKPNPKNPRTIDKKQFEALKTSIQTSPKSLEVSPLIINEDFIVLGGNMRLRALKDLGFSEAPCVQVIGLSEQKQQELIIKDNINYGDWDWNILINTWQLPALTDMGLNVPKLFSGDNTPREQDLNQTKEAFERWLNNDSQQIKLFYDNQTYDYVIDYFKTRGDDNKGQVIQTLIDNYFVKNELIKDRR
jgi:hypothetical protein